MFAVYTPAGVIVSQTTIAPVLADISKKLTVTTRQIIGPDKKINMLVRNEFNGTTRYFIPAAAFDGKCANIRFSAETYKYLAKLTKEYKFKTADVDGFNDYNLTLQGNQQAVANTILRQLRDDGRCILKLRAGFGKTFVAAAVMTQLRQRCLYILPKKPLLEQAYNDLKTVFPRAKITKISTDLFESLIESPPDIGIVVINTAMKLTKEVVKIFGFTILDEVHMYCSPERMRIFNTATAKYTLGMTATPDERQDGFDCVYHAHIDPLIDGNSIAADFAVSHEVSRSAHESPLEPPAAEGSATGEANRAIDEPKFSIDVHVIKYRGPPEYTQNLVHEKTNMVFMSYMHKQFMEDKAREALIVAWIKRLYDQGHYIYVFCEELDIVDKLMQETSVALNTAVLAEKPVDGTEVETGAGNEVETSAALFRFVGGIKTNYINEARNDGRILFTTYGYSGTGVSINKMTAIVFATPRKSNMRQILARIMRRGGDAAITRQVVDIVDANTSVVSQFYERKKIYIEYGARILVEQIDRS